MKSPKLLFLATEDWFVRSHFAPLLQRARQDGFEVVVAARQSGASLGPGVRVIDTPFARGSLKPWDIGGQVAHLRALLQREKPDVVHALAAKPILLLIMSGFRGGRIFALTGRGYLGVRQTLLAKLLSWRLRQSMQGALQQPSSLLLTENEADRIWVGARDDQALVMPGAGVDPSTFTAVPEPAAPPIVAGLVSRLIWSKGIDLAVEAVNRLRARGVSIELRIAGATDPQNPEHVPESELERWRASGVVLLGRVDDINGFWAATHIACLPSRGGEGLPRSLLEAAACGRPIVTSDAPGCVDFVTSDIGLVAAREDAPALAGAIERLATDAEMRARMGAAARDKVLAGYTEAHAAARASEAWRRVLQRE